MKPAHYIFIVFVAFCLLGSCNDNDEYCDIKYVHGNHITELTKTHITSERITTNDFCTIDSIRGWFLFTNMTQHQILFSDNVGSRETILTDVDDLTPDFSGLLEYVYVLPDGNYLLYEHRDDECDHLWKYWPDENRIDKVFTYRNKYQYMKWYWCITLDKSRNIIFLSEYGVSDNKAIDPNSKSHTEKLGLKGGATIIWQSSNNAETWSIHTDFKEQSTVVYNTFHIHSIFYDNSDQRLYATTGDGQLNRCLWWTDGKNVWKHKNLKHYWGNTNDAYSDAQLISIYVDKDFILAGADDFSNCIYRINKANDPNGINLERSYFYALGTKGLITQYTGKFKKLSNGMIAVFLGNGDSNGYPRQTRIVGTFDGYTWQELYKGPYETAPSKLYQMNTFEEWNGCLYFSIRQYNEEGRLERKFIEIKLN